MARILIIDDDEVLLAVISMALTQQGHEVLRAKDGKEGVDLALATHLDLVITDLIMPVQEGVETITILRKELPNLPVIAMSGGARNSALYLKIAGKIGAQRILAKPFGTDELLALIAEVLPPAP
jgi:DNA-binding response OmpR family regulator